MYKWLVDIDLLYRIALTPKIVALGGVGITYELLTWTVTDTSTGFEETGSENDNFGYNFKVGAEVFIAYSWSISGEWKWQSWTGYGEEKFTINSFVLGINWYL